MVKKVVEVDVVSKGLKETTTDAKKLNKELDRLEKPRKIRSGSTGSRAADAALLATEGPISTGLGRGTAAAHGRGDSRDFARQAQGLGGLVHVYATFAANVFAVGAAFNALNRAMDFQVMEKAAATLSTKTGTSIKNLSNDIVSLTDNAVSLKEAFQSAALASTAGLATKEIQGLTKAAKGAAQTMGRDMTDALNRIFRGTVKIEPELLDELGIMVKVNDANREYAQTVNKSVSALTEQERRQAFVNAVLLRADKNYGTLADGGANAYQKVLASILDLSTKVGSTINIIFGPIINALAQSPTALTAVIASLVGLLVRQAIPAIKNYSAAQQEALLEDEKLVKQKIAQLETRKSAISKAYDNEISAERERIGKLKGVLSKELEDLGKSSSGSRKFLQEYLGLDNKGLVDHKAKADAAIKNILGNIDRRLKAFRGRLDLTYQEPQQIYRKTYTTDEALKEIQALKEKRNALRDVMNATNNLSTAAIAANQHAQKEIETDRRYQQALKAQEKLQNRIAMASIRAAAVKEASDVSMTEGFNKLKEGIKTSGAQLSTWAKGITYVRGAAQIATNALAGLISAFSIWGVVVSGVILAVGGILRHFDLVSDKAGKASESYDKAAESLKTYEDTIASLNKGTTVSDYFSSITASIQAQVEALEALEDNYTKVRDLLNNGTGLDNWWEQFKELLPFINSEMEKLSKNQLKTYNTLAAPQRREADAQVQKDTGYSSIEQALEKAHFLQAWFPELESSQREIKKIVDSVEKSIRTLGNSPELKKIVESFKAITSNFKTVSDNADAYILGLTKANKEYDSALASLDNMAKVISGLQAAADVGKLDEFNIGLVEMLNQLTNPQFQAYAGIQGSITPDMAAFSATIKTFEKSIQNITDPAERQGKIQSKVNEELAKHPGLLKQVYTASQRAADNLIKLGSAAADQKIQQALNNRASRLTSAGASIAGDSAEAREKVIKLQDANIRIQISQLNVQRLMLRELMNQNKSNVSTAIIALMKAENKQLGTELAKAANGGNGLSRQDAAKFAQTALDIGYTLANKQETAVQSTVYLDAAELLQKYSTSLVSNTIEIKELDASIIDLKSQLSHPLEIAIARGEGSRSQTTERGGLSNDIKYATKDLTDFNIYLVESITGFESLSSSINSLRRASEKTIDSLLLDNAAMEAVIAEHEKSKQKILSKKGTVSEEDKNAVNSLEASISKLRQTISGNVLKIEFNQKSAQLQEVIASIRTFRDISSTIVDSQNTLVNFNINNAEALGSIFNNASNAVIAYEEAIKSVSNSYTNITAAYEFEYKQLELIKKSTKDIYLINKAEAEQVAITASYKEKILDLARKQVDLENKARTERMKALEENPLKPLAMYTTDNFKNGAEIFVKTLKEGVADMKSNMEEMAIGFANSLHTIIDDLTEAFQKGELTFGRIITTVRNTLSDMFRDLAAQQFKKALASGIESATNALGDKFGIKFDLRTDEQKAQDIANANMSKLGANLETNGTILKTLNDSIQSLISALQGIKVGSTPTAPAVPEVTTPTIEDIPAMVDNKVGQAAETFAYRASEAIETTLLSGNQATSPMYQASTAADPITTTISSDLTQNTAAVQALEGPLQDQIFKAEYNNVLNEEQKRLLDQSLSVLREISSKTGTGGQAGAQPYIEGGFLNPLEDAAIGIDEGAGTLSSAAERSAQAASNSVKNTGVFSNVVRMFGGVGDLFMRAVNIFASGIAGGGGGEFNFFSALLGSAVKAGMGMFTGGFGGDVYGVGGGVGDASGIMGTGGFMATGGIIEGLEKRIPAYASGTITSGPELAMIGEGKNREAVVPLPDNRSIPVTFTGGTPSGASIGDTNIEVNISITNSDSGTKTNTSIGDTSKFGKEIASQIKQVVAKELIDQQKPGGLLYGRR